MIIEIHSSLTCVSVWWDTKQRGALPTFSTLLSIPRLCLRTYRVTCGDERLAESNVEDVTHELTSPNGVLFRRLL